MKSIFVREIRLNLKTVIIWSLSVGLIGLACILLYQNLQGDIVAICDASGNKKVEYSYDAWGKVLSISGDLASTIGQSILGCCRHEHIKHSNFGRILCN